MGRDSPAIWGQCPRESGWEGRPRSVRGTSHHFIHQPPALTAAGKEGKLRLTWLLGRTVAQSTRITEHRKARRQRAQSGAGGKPQQ